MAAAHAMHLVFHARHLERFGTGDAVQELILLGVVIALPSLALWVLRARAGTADSRR